VVSYRTEILIGKENIAELKNYDAKAFLFSEVKCLSSLQRTDINRPGCSVHAVSFYWLQITFPHFFSPCRLGRLVWERNTSLPSLVLQLIYWAINLLPPQSTSRCVELVADPQHWEEKNSRRKIIRLFSDHSNV